MFENCYQARTVTMGLSRLTSLFRNLNPIRTNSTGNWFLQDSFPLFRREIPHNKASISTSTTKFQSDAEVPFMNVLSNSSHDVSVEMAEKFWFEQFTLKNIPEASISIQHILAHTIGFKYIGDLLKEQNRNRILSHREVVTLQQNAVKRLQRMPVQYIVGSWDFGEVSLQMSDSPAVFIPRPETEGLLEIVSSLLSDNVTNKCFEIGVGTGAISLALLKRHKNLNCLGIDTNPAAVMLSRKNSEILRLNKRALFCTGTITDGGIDGVLPFDVQHNFHIVISNPPYISTGDISHLEPEINLYEPRNALDGGLDGMKVVSSIVRLAPHWLCNKGSLILEIDPKQVEATYFVSKGTGCYADSMKVRKDCFGRERFVILTKK